MPTLWPNRSHPKPKSEANAGTGDFAGGAWAKAPPPDRAGPVEL